MDQTASTAPEVLSRAHDFEQISEQLSPSARFAPIVFCLALGLSIAYSQVVRRKHEDDKLNDPPSRTIQTLRVARLIALNAISGALLMMATSIGSHEASLTRLETEVHALLDPHTAQVKIDCFRIHAMHWIQYSSGWQLVESVAKHGYELHLWALPVELICAMFAFVALVMVDTQDLRMKVALAVSALVHHSFLSSWIGWIIFATFFLSHLDNEKVQRPPLLPIFVPKGRKPSRPLQPGINGNTRVPRVITAALGL